MMPSGDYNAWKKIKTSPINHFHQSEEMMCIAGLLPVGNIPTPNTQLQVESTGLIMQSTCNPGASFTMRCYRLLWSTSSQSTRLVRMMEACSTISISLKGSSRSKAWDAPQAGRTIHVQVVPSRQPVQEPRVVHLTQQCQLSLLSSWPTWAAQALQQWWSSLRLAQWQEESPQAQGQGLQALNLDWDETFEDTFVTDIEVADLEYGIQVENLFTFGKWWSVQVEPRKSTSSTENFETVQYKVDLHHSKQLSSFTKMDYCSTNFNSGSTRNAPKISTESHIFTTDSEEVCAISKGNGSNNKVEQTKTVVPQNLPLVTIMLVDIILSVRSRTLLRVLLDSDLQQH